MPAQASAEPVITAPATDVAHAWLRAPIYAELVAEAERRGIHHPDRLAAQLLTAVLLRGFVDAILDRGSRDRHSA